jgi:hypothetical protein
MKRPEKLISLLVSIFSASARLRMLDGKTFIDARDVVATPGLFYRGGAPVRPAFALTFMRAIKPSGRVPMLFVHNAQTNAVTDAMTDLSAFLLE